jgi:Protein of unknown function (DUF2917)
MRSTTFILSRGSVASFGRRERPMSITCAVGLVWVTIEGSRTDHLVEAGQTVRFQRRGRVVIQALRSATVRLERGEEPDTLTVYPPGSRTMSNTPVAVP